MDSIKKFVVAVGLISDQIICNKCNKECHLEVQSDLIPEVKDLQWRCSICRKTFNLPQLYFFWNENFITRISFTLTNVVQVGFNIYLYY